MTMTISEIPKPLRTRFAPTPPEGGGAFIHIGHVAMMLATRELAVAKCAALDVRFDSEPDAAGMLDLWNCMDWLGVLPRRIYLLMPVNETQIKAYGNGDASAFSRTQLAAHFDDVRVENQTIITRDNEFAQEPSLGIYNALDQFWGKTRTEVNFPNLLRGGRKMSKSDDNTLHWTALKDFTPRQVNDFMCQKMQGGQDWEWNWKELDAFDIAANQAHIKQLQAEADAEHDSPLSTQDVMNSGN